MIVTKKSRADYCPAKNIVRVVALDTNGSPQPIARASQDESASYSDQKERDAQPKALALSCLALKMLER
jgi:hypothetical protein